MLATNEKSTQYFMLKNTYTINLPKKHTVDILANRKEF